MYNCEVVCVNIVFQSPKITCCCVLCAFAKRSKQSGVGSITSVKIVRLVGSLREVHSVAQQFSLL